MQLALGANLNLITGWAEPDTGRAYTRAIELCELLGDDRERIVALWGMSAFHMVSGNQKAGISFATESLDIALGFGDRDQRIVTEYAVGIIQGKRGYVADSCKHLELVWTLCERRPQTLLTQRYGMEFTAFSGAWLCWYMWCLGYPDRALRIADEVMAYANPTAHPLTLSVAFMARGILAIIAREPHIDDECLAKGHSIAVSQGFGFWRSMFSVYSGMRIVHDGNALQGIAVINQAIIELEAMGAQLSFPFYYTGLAEGYLNLGRVDEGLAAVKNGLAIAIEQDSPDHNVNLYRLRGELLLAATPPDPRAAERALLQAIDIARTQNHRIYGLRAATSLA